MDSEDHVEKLIKDALSSGELTPTRGLGKPIENLDQDPMWWARSVLRRERAADSLGRMIAQRNRQIERAISAADLSDARSILQSLNHDLAEWNEDVDEEHRLDLLDEIWLLTERENARLQRRSGNGITEVTADHQRSRFGRPPRTARRGTSPGS